MLVQVCILLCQILVNFERTPFLVSGLSTILMGISSMPAAARLSMSIMARSSGDSGVYIYIKLTKRIYLIHIFCNVIMFPRSAMGAASATWVRTTQKISR